MKNDESVQNFWTHAEKWLKTARYIRSRFRIFEYSCDKTFENFEWATLVGDDCPWNIPIPSVIFWEMACWGRNYVSCFVNRALQRAWNDSKFENGCQQWTTEVSHPVRRGSRMHSNSFSWNLIGRKPPNDIAFSPFLNNNLLRFKKRCRRYYHLIERPIAMTFGLEISQASVFNIVWSLPSSMVRFCSTTIDLAEMTYKCSR